MKDTYLYSLRVLDSSWPEVNIDRLFPPAVSARVTYGSMDAANGTVYFQINLFLNDEPMDITLHSVKRIRINPQTHKAYWADWRMEQVPMLGISIEDQKVLFEDVAKQAYDEWVPPTPSYADAKQFFVDKEELLRNAWMILEPPSLQKPTTFSRYSHSRGYLSPVIWLDDNIYYLVRGGGREGLYTDSRKAVMAAYKEVMDRVLGPEERKQGLAPEALAEDEKYLDEYVEHLKEWEENPY